MLVAIYLAACSLIAQQLSSHVKHILYTSL